MKFEVGDRVEIIANGNKPFAAGICGTILAVEGSSQPVIGVEHDYECRGGHSLGGLCHGHYGYWYFGPEYPCMLISGDKMPVSCSGLEDIL